MRSITVPLSQEAYDQLDTEYRKVPILFSPKIHPSKTKKEFYKDIFMTGLKKWISK